VTRIKNSSTAFVFAIGHWPISLLERYGGNKPHVRAYCPHSFGTLETEVLYHLLGNTQATREPRLNTRATDPQRQAVWTLPALAERVQQWADEEYETIVHPALGMTPRDAYALSIKQNGARTHKNIPYDDAFLKATFPTTRKGTAKVEPGVGVRMNYLDYWCEAMRDATVEETQVKVRYDPQVNASCRE
jgi:putative transposase